MTAPVPRQEGETPDLPWSVLDDYRCFGCSPHNPHGVKLVFTEHPDGLGTTFRLGRSHESYPGVVHGGLLGVVCDETMGNLIVLRTGLVAFTASMRMRYLAPVAVGESYTCVARLLPSRGDATTDAATGAGTEPGADAGAGAGLVSTGAQIVDGGGDLVVTATATYRNVPFGSARHRIALSAPEVERLGDALTAAAARHQPVPAIRHDDDHHHHPRGLL